LVKHISACGVWRVPGSVGHLLPWIE
jgi:hypothetical protein